MGWELYLLNFGANWTKESYWQKLLTFCQSHTLNLEDPNMSKQLLYCLTIFFLHCLYDYNISLSPEAPPGQPHTAYCLLEAFVGMLQKQSLFCGDYFIIFRSKLCKSTRTKS